MSDEDRQHDEDREREERQRELERTIALYLKGHDDLIRLATLLLDQGKDLTGLKETIDGLGEREVREVLLVSVAEAARFHFEKRQAAGLN